MKRLERQLKDAEFVYNYSEYTLISSIGEIGISLEEEMERVINPIKSEIATHKEYLEKFDARMKEREKLRQEMDDNKQQLIFWIATLAVIGVSFLMFN